MFASGWFRRWARDAQLTKRGGVVTPNRGPMGHRSGSGLLKAGRKTHGVAGGNPRHELFMACGAQGDASRGARCPPGWRSTSVVSVNAVHAASSRSYRTSPIPSTSRNVYTKSHQRRSVSLHLDCRRKGGPDSRPPQPGPMGATDDARTCGSAAGSTQPFAGADDVVLVAQEGWHPEDEEERKLVGDAIRKKLSSLQPGSIRCVEAGVPVGCRGLPYRGAARHCARPLVSRES